MDYDLANVAVLDEFEGSFFLAFGQTWERLENLDLKELRLEVGAESRVAGRTLGGLFPLNITFGFAYPLLGLEPENRQARLYLELQLPLF